MVVLALYVCSYIAIRQNATSGTIFITPTGSKTVSTHDYRAIVVDSQWSKPLHTVFSPLITLDRQITGTVVTVNVP